MKRIILITVVCGLVFAALALCATQIKFKHASGLMSSEPLDREIVDRELRVQRKETIRELITIIKQENVDTAFRSSVHRAVDVRSFLCRPTCSQLRGSRFRSCLNEDDPVPVLIPQGIAGPFDTIVRPLPVPWEEGPYLCEERELESHRCARKA